MKLRLRMALAGLLSIPGPAMASGDAVLSLVWLEIGLFALVLVSLAVLRLSIVRSLCIFVAYALAAAAALYLTGDMPYMDNLVVINAVSVGLPFLAWALSIIYFLRKRA